FFFSSRRRHTRFSRDWSSDVCSSDLRLLWARVGVPHCPNCGQPVRRQPATQIVDQVLALPEKTRIEVLAPLVRGRKGEFRDLFRSEERRVGKEGGCRGRGDARRTQES